VSAALARQFDLLLRCGAGFFQNAVEQDDFLPGDHKKSAGDPVSKIRTDFPEAGSHRVHKRFSDGPGLLPGQNIRTNGFSVLERQAFQPLANGFVACLAGIESNGKRTRFGWHI
jgi:hypothetical protein